MLYPKIDGKPFDPSSTNRYCWWCFFVQNLLIRTFGQSWQMDTAKGWIYSIWYVLYLWNPVPCTEKWVTLLSTSPHWIDGAFRSASSRLGKGLSFVLQYDSTMIPIPTPKRSWSKTPSTEYPSAWHLSYILISLWSIMQSLFDISPLWYASTNWC